MMKKIWDKIKDLFWRFDKFYDKHEVTFTWFFFIFFSACLISFIVKPPESYSKFYALAIYFLPLYEFIWLVHHYYKKFKHKSND